MYNVLTDRYEPILLDNSEVREIDGLRFGGINGIVALRRGKREGVPRKWPVEFITIAKRLNGKIDVLILHDSPWLEEYTDKIVRNERTTAVGIVVYEAKPKATLCGHLHISPFTIHEV